MRVLPVRVRAWRRMVLSAVIAAIAAGTAYGSARLIDTEGLTCEDFTNPAWEGEPVATRVETDLTAPLLGTTLQDRDRFSTACSGWLFVPLPARMTFLLDSDDGSDLVIDGKQVVNNLGMHSQAAALGSIDLLPESHRITIRYSQAGGPSAFSLLAAPEGESLRPLAAGTLARRQVTHAEFFLRPLARPARAVILPLCAVVLGLFWWAELGGALPGVRMAASRSHARLSSSRYALAILLGVGVGARLVLTPITSGILWPDSYSYYDTARAILGGNWMSHEIFRTSGFPAFMALFLRAGLTPAAGAAMIAAQRVLGILATVLVYRIGRQTLSPVAAFYGALLWTLSPLVLYYETTVASESLFVFVILLTVWVSLRQLPTGRIWGWALTGLLCGLAVLTRPVAQGFFVVLLAAGCWHLRQPRRILLPATGALAAYLACIVPWMYVNSQTHGFFGVSRGQGLGLFMRAFDTERFEPPEDTAFPVVRESYLQFRNAGVPYVHFRVRDDLNYHRGYSGYGADRAMEAFALETIRAHRFEFAAGILIDWVRLFISPHRSVDICETASGPVLCAARSRGDSLPPFPNAAAPGLHVLKSIVAGYVDAVYPVAALLAPLALLGVLLAFFRRGRTSQTIDAALLAATVVYFTVIAVTFSSLEDRYRLPVDAFVFLFAVHGLASAWTTRASRQTVPPLRIAREPRSALSNVRS